jgi:hypothetical protein
MYEYEVVLMERRFGRIRIKADGLEQAQEIALHSAMIEWDDATDAEVIFASQVDQ